MGNGHFFPSVSNSRQMQLTAVSTILLGDTETALAKGVGATKSRLSLAAPGRKVSRLVCTASVTRGQPHAPGREIARSQRPQPACSSDGTVRPPACRPAPTFSGVAPLDSGSGPEGPPVGLLHCLPVTPEPSATWASSQAGPDPRPLLSLPWPVWLAQPLTLMTAWSSASRPSLLEPREALHTALAYLVLGGQSLRAGPSSGPGLPAASLGRELRNQV